MDQMNIARIGFTINLLVDEIGAIFFITLIYVIIKYRNLRKTHCLKLIGIFMFCNLFSKIIIWGPYLIRVIPLVNMPMIVCCGWYLITLTPCNGQLPFSTLIAFDRAVSVFLPTWYSNPNKKFYLLFLCTLGSIYPIYNCVFLVLIAADRPYRSTNCTGGEVFGNYQPFDYQCIYAAIFFYIVMIIKLLVNGKERKSYLNKQPLFKSIALIMAVQICGWFIVKNAYQYIPKIFFNNATENDLPLLYYAINCFSSITVTAEFFAIYISSTEHRKALKKEFPRLYHYFPDKIFEKRSQRVANIQQQQIAIKITSSRDQINQEPQQSQPVALIRPQIN